MENKAVVLGTNYYIGINAIRALGEEGIYVVAAEYDLKRAYGFKSKYTNEKLVVPNYRDEEKFIGFMIDYGKRQEKKPVLIPCADQYVEAIDRNLNKLKEYYLIPQEEKGLYKKVMDKDEIRKLAKENDVLIPESVHIDNENLEEIVNDKIGFPCIIKPVSSPEFIKCFKHKLLEAENMDELKNIAKKSKENNLDVVVQRIIPGFDDCMYTYDAYVNTKGKVTHWMTAHKLRQFPINYGASVFTEQKYVPELHKIGKNFLENIGYKGFAEIEFKKDENTGKYYLIEVNARLTNFDVMIKKVGLNIPYIMYKDLIGEELEPKAIKEDTNITFRYVYEDKIAIWDYKRKGQLTEEEIKKSFEGRNIVDAVWDEKDPKPSKMYYRNLKKKKLRRILARIYYEFFKK